MRGPGARLLCAVAALVACDDAEPLGTLRLPDASAAVDVARARVVRPLRCGPVPADDLPVRVDPGASPYALSGTIPVTRGGPWADGEAYAEPPTSSLFVVDPRCGVRRAWFAIGLDGGPMVDSPCVHGTADARGVSVLFNDNGPGLCLLYGGAAPGFAMGRLDRSRAGVLPSERAPWVAARCARGSHRAAAIGVDARGGRWFRLYDTDYAPTTEAISLPEAPEVVAPATLFEVGGWLSLWETRDGGLQVERIADDGAARASASPPSGWFAGARPTRLLAAREHEGGLLTLVRLAGDRGASLGAALLCPDDTVRARVVLDGAVERAVLRPFGPFFSLFTLRRDGDLGVIEATLLAADLSWRRAPREILRARGLALHDVFPSDMTGDLLVWHSVALDGDGHELRVAPFSPER